jgi:hypothetical protein
MIQAQDEIWSAAMVDKDGPVAQGIERHAPDVEAVGSTPTGIATEEWSIGIPYKTIKLATYMDRHPNESVMGLKVLIDGRVGEIYKIEGNSGYTLTEHVSRLVDGTDAPESYVIDISFEDGSGARYKFDDITEVGLLDLLDTEVHQ